MRAPIQILAGILTSIFALPLSSQTPAAAETRPASSPRSEDVETRPAASESRPSDPAAKAFLADAARRRAPLGEEAIRDVTIQFEAESNLNGRHNEATEATHQFQRPNKIRTLLRAAGSAVERGFDGKQFWVQRGEKVEILSGRENERDRNEIDYSVRFTEHLLQLISLSSLAERMTGLTLLTPVKLDPKSKAEPAPGVRGSLEAFPSLRAGQLRTVTAELRFDEATRDLCQVQVWVKDADGNEEKDPETLVFSDYRVVKGKNVRFPFRVTAFTNNRELPEYKFQVLDVRWNQGLDASIFAPAK